MTRSSGRGEGSPRQSHVSSGQLSCLKEFVFLCPSECIYRFAWISILQELLCISFLSSNSFTSSDWETYKTLPTSASGKSSGISKSYSLIFKSLPVFALPPISWGTGRIFRLCDQSLAPNCYHSSLWKIRLYGVEFELNLLWQRILKSFELLLFQKVLNHSFIHLLPIQALSV